MCLNRAKTKTQQMCNCIINNMQRIQMSSNQLHKMSIIVSAIDIIHSGNRRKCYYSSIHPSLPTFLSSTYLSVIYLYIYSYLPVCLSVIYQPIWSSLSTVTVTRQQASKARESGNQAGWAPGIMKMHFCHFKPSSRNFRILTERLSRRDVQI